jgi:hypothetical protein
VCNLEPFPSDMVLTVFPFVIYLGDEQEATLAALIA